MKRSEINRAIAHAIATAKAYNVSLPVWASWSPGQFGANADGLRRQKLGWKVIDFGQGNFAGCGLVLLVVSAPLIDESGEPLSSQFSDGEQLYPVAGFSRKYLFVQGGQIEPHHYHVQKTRKDVSVLAGASVRFELSWANEQNELTDKKVVVSVDGIWHEVEEGGSVVLNPGQTITLPARLSHVIAPAGDVVLLETSTANNDFLDNFFPFITPTSTPVVEDELPAFQLLDEHRPISLASA